MLFISIHFFFSVRCIGNTDTIDAVKTYYNHAQTYYWYGRYKYNDPEEFKTAIFYIDSAEYLLEALSPHDSASISQKKLITRQLNEIRSTCDEMLEITHLFLNAKFPLYIDFFNFSDKFNEEYYRPRQKAIENALENLMESPYKDYTGKLANVTFFSIIIYPAGFDPEVEEVAHEYMNLHSHHYVFNRAELASIFSTEEMDNFNKGIVTNEMQKKAAIFVQVDKLGLISLKENDHVNGIFYYGASFKEYIVNENISKSVNYSEGISDDKMDADDMATYLQIFFVLIIGFLTFIPGIYYLKKKSVGKSSLWEGLIYYYVGFAISYILLLIAIYGLGEIIPEPGTYWMEFGGKWVIFLLFPAMSILPPLATYLASTKLPGNRINRTHYLGAAFVGSQMGFTGLIFYQAFYTSLDFSWLIMPALSVIWILVWGYSLSENIILLENEKSMNIKYYLKFAGLAISSYIFPILFFYHYPFAIISIISLIIIVFIALLTFPYETSKTLNSIYTSILDKNKDSDTSNIRNEKELISFLNNPDINVTNGDDATGEIVKFISQDDGKLKILTITGEHGSGKSHLIYELRQKLANNGPICFIYGLCNNESANKVPYQPFMDAFSKFMGAGRFKAQDRLAGKLSKAIEHVPIGFLPEIASFFASEPGKVKNPTADELVPELVSVLKKTIKISADVDVEQVVIVLDDIQWIDDQSAELLQKLIRELIREDNKKLAERMTIIYSQRAENDVTTGNIQKLLNQLNNLKGKFIGVKEHKMPINKDFFFTLIQTGRIPFDFKTQERLLQFFREREYRTPLQCLQTLNTILAQGWIEYSDAEFKLTPKAVLEQLPNPDDLATMFQMQLEKLDPELKKYLISAAFINENFEAEILAEIWNLGKKERLDLLLKLKQAEDIGLIIDVSEEDDVYRFVSRSSMTELQKQIGGDTNEGKIHQIVKEYYKRIIDALEKKEGFNPETYNLAIVCLIAQRTYVIHDIMPEKAYSYNTIAAWRCRKEGRHEESLLYFGQALEIWKAKTAVDPAIGKTITGWILALNDLIKPINGQMLLDYSPYTDDPNQPEYLLALAQNYAYSGNLDKLKESITLFEKLPEKMCVEQLERYRFYKIYFGVNLRSIESRSDEFINLVQELKELAKELSPITFQQDEPKYQLANEVLNTLGGRILGDIAHDENALIYLDQRLSRYHGKKISEGQVFNKTDRQHLLNETFLNFSGLSAHDKRSFCYTTNYYGRLFYQLKRFEESKAALAVAVKVNRRMGDTTGMTIANSYKGLSSLSDGKYEEAFICYRQNASESELMGNPYGSLISLGYAIIGLSTAVIELKRLNHLNPEQQTLWSSLIKVFFEKASTNPKVPVWDIPDPLTDSTKIGKVITDAIQIVNDKTLINYLQEIK